MRPVPRCGIGECRFAMGHLGRHAMTPMGAKVHASMQRLVADMERAMYGGPALDLRWPHDDLGRPVDS